MSIIVHESADATDLNDGFGTAELVVGVRAYQWGWEYYYPQSIDLNYNVRSSYSTFLGNSIQYHPSSAKNTSANFLWKMYQNKSEDRVITPAHLLLVPSDSSNVVNFLNFKNIGLNSLSESTAFAKIRNFTKVYNTHLVHTPSPFLSKYHRLNSLYSDENNFLGTSPFSVSKQQNLHSVSSIGNNFSATLLDSESFNRFLDSTTGIEHSPHSPLSISSASPYALTKDSVVNAPVDFTRFAPLLASNSTPLTSGLTKLFSYPTLLNHINDNSDKDGLGYPALQVASSKTVNGTFGNANLLFSQSSLDSVTSSTSSHQSLTSGNATSNPRLFNLSGPNSKVLLGEQSIRSLPDLTPSKSNLNLSSGVNPVSSNLALAERVNRATTPFSNATSHSTGYADYSLVNKAANAQSFSATPHPAVLSSSPLAANSLDYDSGLSRSKTTEYSKTGLLSQTSAAKKSPVGDVFVGSREKTPRSLNTAYWDTFWSTTNSSHRILNALKSNHERADFFLPTFTNYVDYDFRNDQAIDMLEELFWEHSFSGYNFYEYMTLNKENSSSPALSLKDVSLEKQFYASTLGLEPSTRLLTSTPIKDLSLVGSAYGNSIQMEGYSVNPSMLNTQNYSLLPLYAELNEMDDTFSNFKSLSSVLDKFSTISLASSTLSFGSRSYISVLNTFRSDFTDFNWYRTGSDSNSLPENVLNGSDNLASNLTWEADGSTLGSDLRLSNPATLRSSARNSIVNFNAFQKVFKARLDEGRAHVHAASYADLSLKQPFLSDTKVPYLQLLGKDRTSYFETPLYSTSTHKSYNSASALTDASNTPMYDFPFLLAKTSDTARFTWIDWFSKWKHVEVQPSSVSRYSTLGVPYMRKPFDFNSTTGDKFQETELYFTRIARSRRNYLTNWSYSPFMYNRAYQWNALSRFDSALLNTYDSLSSPKLACSEMSWYWLTPAFSSNTSSKLNFSLSGNDIYAKSTWRPKSSIQSYYYNVSKLVDILSRREYLYRVYLEKAYAVEQLPQTLCSTPNNPLLRELKSSFLLSDPANFGSEFSRDLLYTAAPYFKFLYLKSIVESAADSTPINTNFLSNYAFFYLFSTDSTKLGQNSELHKSQFRPLKKGISSMLRLHSTGAVAMPIEIRLQVLASSRDVIHSWAIPSAHIKIDCVPGYTSHRIMKFLLVGTYWGQCQEICGRYHHWMPIVVYFMKVDLFVTWCLHNVMGTSDNGHSNAPSNWFNSTQPQS